jgi:hypothetical protein
MREGSEAAPATAALEPAHLERDLLDLVAGMPLRGVDGDVDNRVAAPAAPAAPAAADAPELERHLLDRIAGVLVGGLMDDLAPMRGPRAREPTGAGRCRLERSPRVLRDHASVVLADRPQIGTEEGDNPRRSKPQTAGDAT